MLKLMIILTILVSGLTAIDANKLYLQDIESKVIIFRGEKLLAFTLPNAEILEARDIMLFEFEKKCESLSGDLWFTESLLFAERKKNKIYKYIAIGSTSLIILNLAVIIIKNSL